MAWSRVYLDELARIQEKLQLLFERALLATGYREDDESGLGRWTPPVDLLDIGDTYRLEAELPGITREDVNLAVDGRTVTLSGRVPPLGGESGNDPSFLRMERTYGPFRRSFELEAPVDAEAMTVRLEGGVLTVLLPKLPQPAARDGTS